MRKTRWRRRLQLSLLLALSVSLTACTGPKPEAPAETQTPPAAVEEQPAEEQLAPQIQKTDSRYILENDRIRVELDAESGYVYTVTNVRNGASHKAEGEGAWPFRLILSESSLVELEADTNCRISSAEAGTEGDASWLRLTYDNLPDDMDQPTGVAATVEYRLGAEDPYLSFRVELENKGEQDICRLDLCRGGSLKPAGEMVQMVLPMWGEMQVWDDPVEDFKNTDLVLPYIMSYPGRGWNDLEMAFADLSGTEGGFGMAYLNSQLMMMDFRVAADQDGMSISPTFLNPEVNGITVPIHPGESFRTDPLLLLVHEGDWHQTADLYREQFYETFTVDGEPDYLTWETLSPDVKKTDAMLRYHSWNYRDILADLPKQMEGWGETLDGSHMMLWLSGYNEHGYGRDVPAMLPVNPEQGTEEEFVAIADYVHDMGGSLWLYEHPFAYDPGGKYYEQVQEADPHQFRTGWDGVLHENLCTDNDLVYGLWQNTIVPEFRDSPIRPDGLQFDQASQQHAVCDLPGHHHGLDAVSRLSSHCKGVDALSKLVRDELTEGKTAYTVSEGFCDIMCRHIDMNQTRWDRPEEPACNGEFLFGGSHYVFPQLRVHTSAVAGTIVNGQKQWVNIRQLGAVIGGITCLNDGPEGTEENCGAYIWLKNQLRQQEAPGYPWNYRDNVGLTKNDPMLAAKVFNDGSRVTVTLWNAGIGEDMEVTLNPEALGLPGAETTFQFRLKPSQTGYLIYNTETGETEASAFRE